MGCIKTMMFRRILIIVSLVLLVWGNSVWAEAITSEVRIRSYNRIPGKTVYLKDIADMTCQNALCDQLKNLEITRSPKPGRKRRMSGSMVEAKIRSVDPLWYKHMVLKIPETIMMERDYIEISDSDITRVFYDFLKKKADGRSFRVRDVTIRGNRKLALGTPEYVLDDRNLKDIEGRVSVTVMVKIPSEGSSKLYVSAWVDLYDQVVCTKRNISRGQLIEKNDLVVKRKNLSKIPGGVVFNPDEVEGTVAKTHISAGEYLRSSMVEPAPLVKKGDLVKIIAESGLLKVVSRGISKEDGALGDQIGVENTRSKRTITARVVDEGTVQVLF